VIAQATAILDGRRIRAQVTTGGARQALDLLGDRLRAQVIDATGPWAPRPWPQRQKPPREQPDRTSADRPAQVLPAHPVHGP